MTEKDRALLVLKALMRGGQLRGNNMVARDYVIEKIEQVMIMDEPESILTPDNKKIFDELLKQT